MDDTSPEVKQLPSEAKDVLSRLDDLTQTSSKLTDQQLYDAFSMWIAKSAPCMIIAVTDPLLAVMRIVRIGQRAEEIFGYSPRELFNRDPQILVPEDRREEHVKHLLGYIIDPKPRQMGETTPSPLNGQPCTQKVRIQGQKKQRNPDGSPIIFDLGLSLEPQFFNQTLHILVTAMTVL